MLEENLDRFFWDYVKKAKNTKDEQVSERGEKFPIEIM